MGNASNKGHRSQEDVNVPGGNRNLLPPPTHPPPPPPVGQLVKVDVCRTAASEYDALRNKDGTGEGESSVCELY